MPKGERHDRQKLDDHSIAPRGIGLRASARYCGCTDWFMRSLAWAGKIPYMRLGKRLIFLKDDLDAYLNAQKIPATTGTIGAIANES